MSSQRRKIIVNAIYNLSGFGGILLINLLVVPYYIHKLSADGYGLYVVLGSLINYAGTLDFGLARGLTKYVAECEKKEDWERMGEYISASVLMVLLIGSLATFCLVIGRDWILDLLIKNQEVIGVATSTLILVALGIPFSLLLMVSSAAVKGLQLYAAINKVNVGIGFASSLLKVLLLALGLGVVELIVTDVVVALLAGMGLLVYLRRKVPQAPYRVRFQKGVLRDLYSFGGFFLIFRVSTTTSTMLPRLVLSAMLGTAAVAYYDVGSKALNALRGILNRATEVVMPAASQLSVEEGSFNKFARSYLEAARYLALASVPMFMLLAIFSFDVLQIWVGESLAEKSAMVLTILSIAYLVGNFSNMPTSFALGQGRTALVAVSGAISLTLIAVTIVPLTKWAGVEGTALSILLGLQVSAMVFIVIYNRSLQMPLFAYVKEVVLFPVLIAGTIAGFAFFIRTAVGLNPFISLALAALSAVVYYGVVWQSSAISPQMKKQLLTMIPGRK